MFCTITINVSEGTEKAAAAAVEKALALKEDFPDGYRTFSFPGGIECTVYGLNAHGAREIFITNFDYSSVADQENDE